MQKKIPYYTIIRKKQKVSGSTNGNALKNDIFSLKISLLSRKEENNKIKPKIQDHWKIVFYEK